MNGVLKAMIYGVSMLVIPFVADQPVNARQVERLVLGKVLDYKSVTGNALKEAALTVMEDPQIRENLQKIRKEITPGIRQYRCCGHHRGVLWKTMKIIGTSV